MPLPGYKTLNLKTITHKAVQLWSAQLTGETGGKVTQDKAVLVAIAVACRHPDEVHDELRARQDT